MIDRLPFRLDCVAARIAAGSLLWAPILLWLLRWPPPTGGTAVHTATAAVLALIGGQMLHELFELPQARPGPGRHRVLARFPHLPTFSAAFGLAFLLLSAWSTTPEGSGAAALAAAPTGLILVGFAVQGRIDPLWGTWIEVADGVLRVHCPRAEGWRVPLAHALAVHVRHRDKSFLLETPWPERDVFVPSREARARYHVTGHRELLDRVSGHVPVRETSVLVVPDRDRGES